MTRGTLEAAIAADPLLRGRVSRLDAEGAKNVRHFMAGLSELCTQLDPFRDVEPRLQYAALCCWELDRLADYARSGSPTAPKGASLIGLALAREEILAPHDVPGQTSYRCAVTLEWLRTRVAQAESNN